MRITLMFKEEEVIREQKQTENLWRLILFKNEYRQDSPDYRNTEQEYYQMHPMKGEEKKSGLDGETKKKCLLYI